MHVGNPSEKDYYRLFSRVWSHENSPSLNLRWVEDDYPYALSPDILALGCSNTEGVGLPFGWAWPEILKVSTGLSVNNCSQGGSGPFFHLHAAMEVISKYGKPKRIYYLIPDLDRVYSPYTENANESECYISQNITFDYQHYDYAKRDISGKRNKYRILNPLGQKLQIPRELSVHNAIISLKILFNYCHSEDVELFVSSWCGQTIDFLESISFPNLIKPLEQKHRTFERCGREEYVAQWFGLQDSTGCSHRPESDVQDMLWDIAEDFSHPGLHGQIHYAEHFSGIEVTQEHIKRLTCSF